MKNILQLNGGKQFAHSDGRLNATLHEAALAHLDRAGFDVRQTFIDGGYDVREEVEVSLGRRGDLPDARLVDGRTVDGEEVHR